MKTIFKPVINPKTSHFGSNFWDGFSNKINRDVNFYSDLEYEHWILVETNPLIVSFCEQPKKIRDEYEGDWHESIFDMWIKWYNGKEEFIEIKYEKDVADAKTRLTKRSNKIHIQLQIQQSWCRRENYPYRLVTESDIRRQPELSNRKMFLPFIRGFENIDEIVAQKVYNLITKEEKTISELFNLSGIDIFILNPILFYLYYQGKISIDFEKAFYTNQSKVRKIHA
ncbi:TnsA endonuclease N-terminal domain-containing protein [Bacillus canaveralius]|uniref:TnsA endonuclease N-terminal domain-containing protein n=1 Tax=Bacillus canaveralius TaxID=1403243 RepID=UPI00163B3254|nr:TnsA endonuclease N-terminal domain-containing protein [Bacillus canaveralius]